MGWWTCLLVWLMLFFRVFTVQKYIKIMFFFKKKIIFNINKSKFKISKNTKNYQNSKYLKKSFKIIIKIFKNIFQIHYQLPCRCQENVRVLFQKALPCLKARDTDINFLASCFIWAGCCFVPQILNFLPSYMPIRQILESSSLNQCKERSEIRLHA